MKNADLPAMPLSNEMSSDLDNAIGNPKSYGAPTATGLTKREAFAMAAMQGLSANIGDYNSTGWERSISRDAVIIADALLNELNKGDNNE